MATHTSTRVALVVVVVIIIIIIIILYIYIHRAGGLFEGADQVGLAIYLDVWIIHVMTIWQLKLIGAVVCTLYGGIREKCLFNFFEPYLLMW